MSKKSQFQNLVLQQTLLDSAQQPTIVQPAITLPLKPEALVPLPPAMPTLPQSLLLRPGIEATAPKAGEVSSFGPDIHKETTTTLAEMLFPRGLPAPRIPLRLTSSLRSHKMKQLLRGAALLLSVLLILVVYLTWHASTPTSASPTITQSSVSNLVSTPAPQAVISSTATPTTSGNTSGTIQVYIVGAVKHPGVYTLATDARVYQLIQAAGGTQPNADLVSIDLAARLTDGQEIYVLSIGETPPAYTNNSSSTGASSGTPTTTSGTQVNINTATETQMEQGLHVSATTAKKIIAYRTQYGAYTSVDQLLQVISQTIYDRIKNMVTV